MDEDEGRVPSGCSSGLARAVAAAGVVGDVPALNATTASTTDNRDPSTWAGRPNKSESRIFISAADVPTASVDVNGIVHALGGSWNVL